MNTSDKKVIEDRLTNAMDSCLSTIMIKDNCE